MSTTHRYLSLLWLAVGGLVVSVSAASGGACCLIDRSASAGGEPASDQLGLHDLRGEQIRLSELEGKVVVLNMRPVDQVPEDGELGELGQLERSFGADRVQIVGVETVDLDAADMCDLLSSQGVSCSLQAGESETAGDESPVNSLPTTLLIDQKGVLRESFEGPVNTDHLRNAIAALLAG